MICNYCKKEIKKADKKKSIKPFDEQLENDYHWECYFKKWRTMYENKS